MQASPSPGLRTKELAGLLAVLVVFLATRWLAREAGLPMAGPLASVVAVIAIAVVLRIEGRGFRSLGLHRPHSWPRAILIFVLAIAVVLAVAFGLMPLLQSVFGENPPSGRFDYLKGDPLALVLSIIGIAWLAAAFGEEVVWRGFVLGRVAQVLGDSRLAWLSAVLLQAIAFGLLHGDPVGRIAAAAIGLGFGLLFWLGMRNLWPLILAHAVPDTVSFVGIYQGG